MAAAALHMMLSLLAAMQFPRLCGMFLWGKVGAGGKDAYTNYMEDTDRPQFYVDLHKPHSSTLFESCVNKMHRFINICIFIHLSLNQTKLSMLKWTGC